MDFKNRLFSRLVRRLKVSLPTLEEKINDFELTEELISSLFRILRRLASADKKQERQYKDMVLM
jgi:hypothetical protein